MANIYMSTDSGSPQLSGQAGSLVALLDAVLVDGYGTGVDRKEGAGWTREFTSTNKRGYRNNPVSGTGFYLQIDDSASAGTPGYCFARGFGSMTAFDVGLNPAPVLAVGQSGLVLAKSSQLNGGARRWLIIADDRIVYIFINPWPSGNYYHPYFFGDFISYKPGDVNNWCIGTHQLPSFSESTEFDQRIFTTSNSYGNVDASRPSLYLPSTVESPSRAVVAYLVGGFRDGSNQAWGGAGNLSSVYPDPVSQGLLFSNVQIFESGIRPRGQLPGIIAPLHNRPLPELVRQPAGHGLGDAVSLLAVNFTGRISTSASATQEGQVIFLEGGDWWQ
ncbi:hypothetical protein RY963_002650 [Stenotrophomonas maltophilia]|nr:hypothetical protein [Stenotrophomonas maltophilia]ELN2593786.1 hypothetical protein [Stenotrophomonas maltophilia]